MSQSLKTKSDRLKTITGKVQEGSDFMNVKVLVKRCPQNHPCPAARICPVQAIAQKGFLAPVIDEDKCIKCGKCIKFCPMGAIVAEEQTKIGLPDNCIRLQVKEKAQLS